ncbi:acetate--CoA ligase family protein [Haloquadratum walsbyi]|jgi:hypothetical protein|uniref:Uncharacterized protein n=1 Tax=Haloquadratum walsbyi J07HQW2 TaxID=1238425 RepID=U1PL30_9EURY|nr:acetate--CoA ligase family protein [Haloquadratum walsbyi]ERG94382.1 MAG: hypothetical protein J07HQW2_00816 [Haloquadratum walsbyi J07HQW2]
MSINAVVDLLIRVSDLATDADMIAELDLNPIVVTEDGPVALDTLVRTCE